MKKVFLGLFLFLILGYYFFPSSLEATKSLPAASSVVAKKDIRRRANEKIVASPVAPARGAGVKAYAAAQVVPAQMAFQPKNGGAVLKVVLEDGLAVAQGDMIAGAPTDPNLDIKDYALYVELPRPKVWPTSEIPYYIEPGVVNPDRILEAVEFFKNSAVHFVPYNNQQDGIVFTPGTEHCKSYVGHVGNLQPIFLTENCSSVDIAHELMHALGFVHEQNRIDREEYIHVLFENVDEKNKENFEKLPQQFMEVSGRTPFDFESLMLYPTWMFSKNGAPTMQSISGQPIKPTEGLSRNDLERLNQTYDSK